MATPTAAQHMSQRHQQLQQQQQQQQNQSAREADLSAQAALNIEDTPPVHIVQIVPLVQLPSPSPLKQANSLFWGVGSDENNQTMSRLFPCSIKWPSPWSPCQGSPTNHEFISPSFLTRRSSSRSKFGDGETTAAGVMGQDVE